MLDRLMNVIISILLLFAISCSKQENNNIRIKQVIATMETEPVASSDDTADDPCIWVHPTDPSLSLIIGTDKDENSAG